MLNALYRRSLLGVADAPPVESFVKTQGWKLGVNRFVAGEGLDTALPALQELESKGLYGIFDLLGEFVDTEAGAAEMTDKILMTLDRLKANRLKPLHERQADPARAGGQPGAGARERPPRSGPGP